MRRRRHKITVEVVSFRRALQPWVLVLFLLVSAAAFGSIGSDQPKQVQCGDGATGTWQNPCPTVGGAMVSAGGLDTTGASGAYVDVKWTTDRCASSVVILMRDANFATERQVYGDGMGSDGCDAGFAKNHLVHVDHLSPSYQGTPAAGFEFGSKGSHYFYVASQDKTSGKWSTSRWPVQWQLQGTLQAFCIYVSRPQSVRSF